MNDETFDPALPDPTDAERPWYHGITRYQWLVLLIASLGWVFDVFEGQIYVVSRDKIFAELLPASARVAWYDNINLGAFLVGGAVGGVFFGILSDRIGRKKTMTFTILMYSACTCLSALSQEWWQMAGFRFLVALGVGGEWAVASAMVAEVFPKRARAWSLGIFHASSVFGTLLATAAGAFVLPALGWRWCFVLGVAPALLVIWVRMSLREPENWVQAKASALDDVSKKLGSFTDLFRSDLRRNTLVGVSLAAIGLATFWGVHIFGMDVLKRDITASYLSQVPERATDALKAEILAENATAIKRWQMLGFIMTTLGGGLGLVSFGPLCERWGRRGAFLFFHLGGLVSALIVFQLINGVNALLVALPIFGYLTLGMHAGYAIYFPELFPTRLRGTGGGFCFNVGRIIAAPILLVKGWLQSDWGLSFENAASLLSLLFLLGVVVLLFAPETKGKDLPE